MNIESIAKGSVVSPATLNGVPGMTSLEIAEITGKNHKHVLRDIKKMVTEIGPNLDRCHFVETQSPDTYGRLQPLTILDKELTFTLLSRYSFTLSHMIVRRWLELEGTGFERMSVRAAVVHLIEREKEARREALRLMKKGPRRPLTAAQKESRRLSRMQAAEVDKARKAGREHF